MLKQLKLVRGVVSKTTLQPVMSHFMLRDGKITGTDGVVAIVANCPELRDLSITVPAEPLLKALDAIGENEPQLEASEHRVVISGGPVKVRLPTGDPELFPAPGIDTKRSPRSPDFLKALKAVEPFMGTDASRPWAMGVLLDGKYAIATNNVSIAIAKCRFPGRAVIPSIAVRELIRIGERPKYLYLDPDRAAAFEYDWGVIYSQLYEDKWPDIHELFEQKYSEDGGFETGPLQEAVRIVRPFCAGRIPIVITGEDRVKTDETGDTFAEVKAAEYPESHFNADLLLLALEAAEYISLGRWPAPVSFWGKNVRGLLMGVTA